MPDRASLASAINAAQRRAGQVMSASYLGFTTGTGLSSLGDAAWYIALSWTLANAVSAGAAGALLAASTLPRLMVLLLGGAVADRLGRKAVMIACDFSSAAIMILAALAVHTIGHAVWVLLIAASGLSVAGAFFMPASGALRPQLLDDGQLVRGNALYSLAQRGGQAAGGPIGAAVLGAGGAVLVALVNAASYLISAAAVSRTCPVTKVADKGTAQPTAERAPEASAVEDHRSDTIRASVADGLRYVWHRRRIRILMLVLFLNELSCAGPLNIGLALFAKNLSIGEGGAGALLAAFAIGAAAGFLAMLAFPAKRRSAGVFVAALGGQGALLIALAFATTIGQAFTGYCALGALLGVTANLGTSMMQAWSAGAVRGRVMSVLALLAFAAILLGNLLIGLLTNAVGVGPAIAAHAAFTLGALLAFAAEPQLRAGRLA